MESQVLEQYGLLPDTVQTQVGGGTGGGHQNKSGRSFKHLPKFSRKNIRYNACDRYYNEMGRQFDIERINPVTILQPYIKNMAIRYGKCDFINWTLGATK